MNCQNCGTKLSEDARFCTACGTQVSDNSKQNITVSESNQNKDVLNDTLNTSNKPILNNTQNNNSIFFGSISKGRISRETWWKYNLSFFIITFFLYLISFTNPDLYFKLSANSWACFFWLAYCFLLVVLHIVVSVKRLHDLNQTGWWHIIVLLGSMLSYGFSSQITGNLEIFKFRHELRVGACYYEGILCILAWLPQIILYGFFKGNNGPNKYGEDPLQE